MTVVDFAYIIWMVCLCVAAFYVGRESKEQQKHNLQLSISPDTRPKNK